VVVGVGVGLVVDVAVGVGVVGVKSHLLKILSNIRFMRF
jgi:hypothetical protein